MNKMFLSGNVVADPEARQVAEKTVCNFRIAVWRPSTKDHPESDFFDCEAWEGRADRILQNVHKGMRVSLEGTARNEKWTDKDGKNRTNFKVRVDQIDFFLAAGARQNDSPSASTSSAPPSTASSGSDDELPF